MTKTINKSYMITIIDNVKGKAVERFEDAKSAKALLSKLASVYGITAKAMTKQGNDESFVATPLNDKRWQFDVIRIS